MITSFLLYIIYGFILLMTLPLKGVPDVSFPQYLLDIPVNVSHYYALGHSVLPLFVNTMLLTWGLYLVIEIGINIYKGIMWIIHRLPGQGGSSPG